jgi:hypothetical protein
MKRFNLLSVAVIALLMVTAVSCTTVGSASDEGYANETSRRRVYMNNSAYGQDVYLVRDPHTGRLYQVVPYGQDPFSSYNSWNYNYGNGYGNRGYGYGYPSRGYSRPGNTTSQPENKEKINEAKRRLRGE